MKKIIAVLFVLLLFIAALSINIKASTNTPDEKNSEPNTTQNNNIDLIVAIIRPEKYLYVFDKAILPTNSERAVIMGKYSQGVSIAITSISPGSDDYKYMKLKEFSIDIGKYGHSENYADNPINLPFDYTYKHWDHCHGSFVIKVTATAIHSKTGYTVTSSAKLLGFGWF